MKPPAQMTASPSRTGTFAPVAGRVCSTRCPPVETFMPCDILRQRGALPLGMSAKTAFV